MNRAFALAALAALASSCGGARASARDVLASLRGALAVQDGKAMRDLLDAESIGFRTQLVREWRALLEEKTDPKIALGNAPFTAEEIMRGDEMDGVALLLERQNPLMQDAGWYLRASVVAEQNEGDDATVLRLRGLDGDERDLWFLRENGRWTFDLYRTKRPWN